MVANRQRLISTVSLIRQISEDSLQFAHYARRTTLSPGRKNVGQCREEVHTVFQDKSHMA
jgi:hypothetical protein